jgi:hypothetical protein
MSAAVRTSPVDTMSQPAGKRKRGNEDVGRNIKDAKHTQPEDDYSLLQGSVDFDSQRAAQDALSVPYPDNAFDSGLVEAAAFASNSPTQSMNTPQHGLYSTPGPQPTPGAAASDGGKPSVGTDEWHKARKDSHKEGKLTHPPHPPQKSPPHH